MPKQMRQIINLCEMANLDQSLTGVNALLHCGRKGGARHSCRVKVSNNPGKMTANDTFSLGLHDGRIYAGRCDLSTKTLAHIRRWMFANKTEILRFWNGQVNELDFLLSIKKTI